MRRRRSDAGAAQTPGAYCPDGTDPAGQGAGVPEGSGGPASARQETAGWFPRKNCGGSGATGDERIMLNLILPGRPITKKNHQRIITNRRTGRPRVIQSKDYEAYETACLWHLKKYRVKYTGPVQVTARYWMPNRRSWPDLVGLLQATCDILEKAGIIENDRNVVSLDGSRIMGVDKKNPRAEIEIKEVG